MRVMLFVGHGEMNVRGGKASGYGGGGAGGRIAVHCRYRYWFVVYCIVPLAWCQAPLSS